MAQVYSEDQYEYGFNGKLKDNEWAGVGNHLDFGARGYDTRIARWINIDPLAKKYPNFRRCWCSSPTTLEQGKQHCYFRRCWCSSPTTLEQGKQHCYLSRTYHSACRYITPTAKICGYLFFRRCWYSLPTTRTQDRQHDFHPANITPPNSLFTPPLLINNPRKNLWISFFAL